MPKTTPSRTSPRARPGRRPERAGRARAARKRGPPREEKLQNLISNYSMVFMGIFEEGFSALAENMADATGKTIGTEASGSEARASRAVRAEIRSLFFDIRQQMASQWPKDPALFKRYISDPAFDKGIEVVERYDFQRPKLTEKLSDEVLASYVFLLQSGDRELARMFKELDEWQRSLPKAPWAT